MHLCMICRQSSVSLTIIWSGRVVADPGLAAKQAISRKWYPTPTQTKEEHQCPSCTPATQDHAMHHARWHHIRIPEH